MSLIDLFMAITLAYTVLSVLLVVIVGSSAWVMRTWAWWILGGSFTVWGLWRVSAFMRLPTAIMEAQMKGTMPTSLTITQWVDAVVIPLLFLIGLIVGFGILRYDINRIVRTLKELKAKAGSLKTEATEIE